MIEELDLLVRLVAIGASLMLLALLVEGEMRSEVRLSVVGLVVGTVGYLINSTPLIGSSGWIDPWVDLVSLSPPFWIWLFARQLFEREPPRRVVLLAVSGLLIGWLLGWYGGPVAMASFYGVHLVSLALIVDLVRVALMDREDDLVEKRRVVRLVLPLLVAAQAGGILVFEMLTATAMAIPWVQLLNAALILVLILFAGLALLRTDPELLWQRTDDEPLSETPPPLTLTPSESVLHEKLMGAMDKGAYRITGLTIAALADQLGTPEHRLRALINRRLGYRNFSAFLNRHRIAEAREKLVDKQSVDVPILTIAMDLGYNSLATFNRAFRAETGTTPSDFRRLDSKQSPAQN
ncbi:MAG: helix-turn-helix domain-containing protein [Erythrobacter sp.]|uniref:AraC family transcriptional regulator n=1 Tax=Erythrobacter sp. TaxID=1042 RepID=UPI0026356E1D|nr:helix-turn-helix domain-containing protein [Erythrobacter sp.]MDJ0977098.1 helix-turn-helix domain-containing protein [Erythrobacter sp.]